MRHNLSAKGYWLGKDAVFLLEREADLGWVIDGSMLQNLATALTDDEARKHVVPYENLTAVG